MLPIGVFDSGVGGLTVFDALTRRFPGESIVYFGDTGRYPYGVRSAQVISEYARQITVFLEDHNCKMIVVACNSASAVAMDIVAQTASVPTIGVIKPGARAAAAATQSGRIGVIGTEATIRSESYTKAIHEIRPDAHVIGKPCPLFVALAEEGYAGHKVTQMIASEYLQSLYDEKIDTLVLGCTHYPLLEDDIGRALGDTVTLVDSASAVAEAAGEILPLDTTHSTRPEHRFYVSDTPERFRAVGARFLGRPVEQVTVIDPEQLAHPKEWTAPQ